MTRSICLCLLETPNGGIRPCFSFELDAEPTEAPANWFTESILTRLIALNADFPAAWQDSPETLLPLVEVHRIGEGPFGVNAGRIKQ